MVTTNDKKAVPLHSLRKEIGKKIEGLKDSNAAHKH